MTNTYVNTKVHSGFAEDKDFEQKVHENIETMKNIFNHFNILITTEYMHKLHNHNDFNGLDYDLVMINIPKGDSNTAVFKVEYNKTTLGASEIALVTSNAVTPSNLANGFSIYGNEITIYY